LPKHFRTNTSIETYFGELFFSRKTAALLLLAALLATQVPGVVLASEPSPKSELRLWHSMRSKSGDLLESAIAEFNAESKSSGRHVRIIADPPEPPEGSVAERMLIERGAGRLPDLALVGRSLVPMLAEAGLIKRLEDVLWPQSEDGPMLRRRSENLLDPARSFASYDGSLYGIPAYLDPFVLIYAPDALERLIGSPEPPESWAELIGLAEDLENQQGNGSANWVLSVRSAGPIFHILCAQRGVNIFDIAPDWEGNGAESPEYSPVGEVLEFIRSLRQARSLLAPQYKFWDPKFADAASGRALFQIDTATMFARLRESSSIPLSAAAVPSESRPLRTALGGAPVFVVTSGADPEVVRDFLVYFYSSELYSRFVSEGMLVSPWKDSASSEGESPPDDRMYSQRHAIIAASAENAIVSPLHGESGKVMPRIARIVERFDAGLIDVPQAQLEIFQEAGRRGKPGAAFRESPQKASGKASSNVSSSASEKVPGNISANASWNVSWAESTRRVSGKETGAGHPPPVRIAASRNEHESFQLLLRSEIGFDGLTLKLAPFLSRGGEPCAVAVDMAIVEDTYIVEPMLADRPGQYPNILKPFKQFSVLPGQTTRIWIGLSVDDSAEPGRYSSRIEIRRDSPVTPGELADMPMEPAIEFLVELEVLPLRIPEAPSHPAMVGLNYDLIAEIYGLDEGSAEYHTMMDSLYWGLVEHRMTPLVPPSTFDSGDSDGSCVSPKSSSYMNDERVSGMRLAVHPADELFEKTVAAAEEGGWLDKVFSYYIDEPTYHQYGGIIAAGERIHSMQDSPRFLVTCFPDDALIGSVDIWCVHLRFLPEGIPYGRAERRDFLEAVRRRSEAGDEVWWYTAGAVAPFPTLHIEDDPAAFRIIPWMQQLYEIDGFLHWEVANWKGSREDIFEEPLIEPFGNGEGVLIYPGESGPISSVRLELLREGLEDMEYLVLLRRAVERARLELAAETPGEAASIRVGEMCRRLIRDDALQSATLGAASPDMLLLPYFSREPGLIEQVRGEVVEEILLMGERPWAIVLTEPREKQYTLSDEARIYGAVEPGCSVTINGLAASVGESGEFSSVFPLVSGANEFEILLEQGGRTKLIRRKIERY
jgi:ABC-type glycerol-3-phosphate transport system substrate-binding protein